MHKNLYCDFRKYYRSLWWLLKLPTEFYGDNHFSSFCGIYSLLSIPSSAPSSHSFSLKSLFHLFSSVHIYISYLHLSPDFLSCSFIILFICLSYRRSRLFSSNGGRYSEASPCPSNDKRLVFPPCPSNTSRGNAVMGK